VSQAAINKIINDAVFLYNTKQTVDGIRALIEKFAETGLSKAVATELTIGQFQAKGLYYLSGVDSHIKLQ